MSTLVGGALITYGQYVKVDNFIFRNVRFVNDNLDPVDTLDDNSDLEFTLVEEIDP